MANVSGSILLINGYYNLLPKLYPAIVRENHQPPYKSVKSHYLYTAYESTMIAWQKNENRYEIIERGI
jgi:hypothetical protein